MKSREYIILAAVSALVAHRLLSIKVIATIFYTFLSYLFRFDSEVVREINFDGQIEDNVFEHRFIQLTNTLSGKRVNVTYHAVECGSQKAEPIVFIHGLAETWKVWKEIMLPFCSSHRAIAIDLEGQGQSHWPNILEDLSDNDARGFM